MFIGWLLSAVALLPVASDAGARTDEAPGLRLDHGHPWRPPFGLDRVGRPPTAVVAFPASRRPPDGLWLAVLYRGNETTRYAVKPPDAPPFEVRVPLDSPAEELVLYAAPDPASRPEELARRAVSVPEIEAEAIAWPDSVVNPVDLGTVLVPSGWLLLGPGAARLEVAALHRTRDVPSATLSAWFELTPMEKATAKVELLAGRRVDAQMRLPSTPSRGDRDVVRVVLAADDGRELWRKAIPVMIVRAPAGLPTFGATRLKLRFDAPISVRDPQTGEFSSMAYEEGWDPDLDDVVVSLPNGARFVFWRGSSYIPFWAGRHNTGLCTEGAENIRRPADAVDCVEPLMDKELRYGRVEIVESTPARVHVRWRYQSTDLHYKAWGDAAVEDYYFYPDGFGTRVVDLKCDPASDYELSEFILLAPQDAYPFAVVPDRPIEVLGADGAEHAIALPIDRAAEAELHRAVRLPAIYRVRLHPDEEQSAIYFNPGDRELPPVIFAPFSDRGEVVTPAYWGSHWPLVRGNATGSAIDERIHATPSHNSLMSWAGSKPDPIRGATVEMLDALGRPRTMLVRRWAWLIGMTDVPDDRLRAVVASYARPPALEARGARLDFDAYAPDRRALRLVVEGREMTLDVKPAVPAVNPVFELLGAPAGPLRVSRAGRPLLPERYAWDGRVLWLDATLEADARFQFTFGDPARSD